MNSDLRTCRHRLLWKTLMLLDPRRFRNRKAIDRYGLSPVWRRYEELYRCLLRAFRGSRDYPCKPLLSTLLVLNPVSGKDP